MSRYTIKFDSQAKKDFKSIQTQDMKRIKSAISELGNNPRPSLENNCVLVEIIDKGNISFKSSSGYTNFQVRLPINRT